MNIEKIINGLNLISARPGALLALLKLFDTPLSLPNMPFPTMGGEKLWNSVDLENGWKMQQNQITQHVRLLDENNVRRAWGTKSGMERKVEFILKKYD